MRILHPPLCYRGCSMSSCTVHLLISSSCHVLLLCSSYVSSSYFYLCFPSIQLLSFMSSPLIRSTCPIHSLIPASFFPRKIDTLVFPTFLFSCLKYASFYSSIVASLYCQIFICEKTLKPSLCIFPTRYHLNFILQSALLFV